MNEQVHTNPHGSRSGSIRAASLAGLALGLLSTLAPGIAHSDGAALSFSAAVTQAVQNTPAARIAGLKAREAEARVGQARGLLLPSLTGTASQVNRTSNLKTSGFSIPHAPGAPGLPDQIGPYDVMDARLTVRQPLFDAANWYRLRAARSGVAGASADADAAAEQAAQNAGLAYLQAARAWAVVDARETDLSLAQELLSAAEDSQRAGISPAIDTTRARTQVVAAQGALLLARNGADRARIALARALGSDPASPPAPSDTLSADLGASDAPLDPSGLMAYARQHRPELLAEQARLARSNTERTAISAERLPRVEAAADWGVSGIHWNDAFPTRQYGVALTLPLLDGLRREARIAEQSSLSQESELRVHEATDQVAADVAGALLDLTSGSELLRVADERVSLAEAELRQARERFTSGVSGNIEVINAQTSRVRALDAQIDARYAIAAARIAVARAAGAARTIH